MKKLKEIVNRFPFLKYLGNKYVLSSLLFILWMVFLDNYSYFEHRILDKQIEELEDNISYYKKEIAEDSLKIKKLKNTDQIEKYAREKYYMKRANEDVYLIEYEDDQNQEDNSDL